MTTQHSRTNRTTKGQKTSLSPRVLPNPPLHKLALVAQRPIRHIRHQRLIRPLRRVHHLPVNRPQPRFQPIDPNPARDRTPRQVHKSVIRRPLANRPPNPGCIASRPSRTVSTKSNRNSPSARVPGTTAPFVSCSPNSTASSTSCDSGASCARISRNFTSLFTTDPLIHSVRPRQFRIAARIPVYRFSFVCHK